MLHDVVQRKKFYTLVLQKCLTRSDEPEDEGYLVRLAREEPANYMSYALKPDGLQGYVDAMNVFN